MTGILLEPSTKSYRYIVLGTPTPLARGRIKINGRGIYDSQKKEKLAFGLVLKSQYTQFKSPDFIAPIHIVVNFYMPIPSSSKKNQFDYHHVRPDLDNLIKFVLDSANTILFKDDAQISTITASKRYDDLPRTELIIKQ